MSKKNRRPIGPLDLLEGGFILVTLRSEYYGSHEEYGEGDMDFHFAIPAGVAMPEIILQHGHNSTNWEERLALLPQGTLKWEDGGWVAFRRPTGPGWDDPGEVGVLPEGHRLLVLNPGEFPGIGWFENRPFARFIGVPMEPSFSHTTGEAEVVSFLGHGEEAVEVAFNFPTSMLEWTGGKWVRSPMAGSGFGYFEPAPEFCPRWFRAKRVYDQRPFDRFGKRTDQETLVRVLEALEGK